MSSSCAYSHCPQKVRWGLSYASGYFHLGMFDEAKKTLSNLGTKYQSLPNLMSLQGLIFIAQKKWKNTLDHSIYAIKIHPDIADFYIQAAYALEQLGRAHEALRLWLKVPDSIRTSSLYHYHVAHCQASLGQKKAACQYLRAALLLDPKIANIIERDPLLQPFLTLSNK